MASSPLEFKPNFHVRSASLPSKSHPLISQFNDCLCRLTDSGATSSSLSSMSLKLSSLESLYDCVDGLLHTQQTFSQECQKNLANELLDGYLQLLDACETTKDVFSQTRQDLQQLLSALRRRHDTNEFSSYFVSRRKVNKIIKKSLKNMNGLQKCAPGAQEKDCETIATISMLNEVQCVTLSLLESLLSYIAGKKGKSSWSLVSRLMHSRKVSGQDNPKDSNEFDRLEAMLLSFTGNKATKSGSPEDVQNELKEMDSSLQILEEGLETLFKRLIKTRVSLLNILTH